MFQSYKKYITQMKKKLSSLKQQNEDKLVIPSFNKFDIQVSKLQKNNTYKQTDHISQRFLNVYQNQQDKNNKQNKILNKFYRSHSDNKQKKFDMLNDKQSFFIRIPKDQNMIENYIQQLKTFKTKIAQQRQDLKQRKQAIQQRKNKFQQGEQLQNIYQFIENKQSKHDSNKKINNDDLQSKRLFARDKKMHLKKLKIIKQFANNQYDQFQQLESSYKNHQFQQKINVICSEKLNKINKIVYGDFINIKQEIKMAPQKRNFDRYSSGRRLYSISKSTDLKKPSKYRYITQQSKQNRQYSHSTILKSQKTHESIKKQISPKKIKNIIGSKIEQKVQKPRPNSSPYKDSKKPQQDRIGLSPKKNIEIKQKKQKKLLIKLNQNTQPFKSIQGFSTIQQKKQTLDILGQSCIDIKNNLIQSGKKMDHILDLLGLQTKDLNKLSKSKQKPLFQRLSKAFPAGFFK